MLLNGRSAVYYVVGHLQTNDESTAWLSPLEVLRLVTYGDDPEM